MDLDLADRLAIHEVIALHGHVMDAGEFDRMEELFTADVVYDVEAFGAGVLHGIGAIVEAALALGPANPLAHHVTNIVVMVEGDVVRARSKGFSVASDGSIGSVVYDDVLARGPAGWRIARRRVIPRREPLTSWDPASTG